MDARRPMTADFLHIPTFDDPEKTKTARLLHILHIAMIFITVPVALSQLLLLGQGDSLIMAVTAIPMVAALMVINHRGAVQLASVITCFIFWGGLLVASVPFGGLYDRIFAWMIIPVAAAGLLLGGRGALFFAVLTFVVAAGQTVMAGGPPLLVALLTSNTAFNVALVVLMGVAEHNTHLTLRRVMANEQRAEALSRDLAAEVRQHQQTAETLRQRDTQYYLLIDQMPVAISLTDAATLRVIYTNRAARQLIGHESPETITGQPALTLVPAAYQPLVAAAIRTTLTAGSVILTDWALLRRDGDMVPVESQSALVEFAGVQAILSAYIDLTERKRAALIGQQAETARAEIEQERQKIAARENMLNTASHQFRTPLAVIISSQQLLKHYEDRMPPEKRQHHYDTIYTQAQYMSALLEDLLEINKSQAGKLEARLEPLALAAFCRQLVEEYASTHGNYTFHYRCEIEGLYLFDPKLLRHITNNLLSNAMKYSPERSTVTITLERKDTSVIFSVEDQGIGVPPEDLDRVFEAFYRGSNTQRIHGTGLGLAIVKSSAEAQGGSVGVRSTPGEGTTFTVRLPLVSAVTTADTMR